jgi:transposase InsO family protein
MREQENTALRQRIRDEFERSRRTYGSPRIARALGRAGSHNRVARLMREEQLWARQRSKYRPRTTDSSHSEPIAPNRLLALAPKRPNEVWATDATCVLTGEGWMYVVALIDLYSRRIVGWAMHQHLDAEVAISALKMAILQRRPQRQLVVHSDRGMQFASHAYRSALVEHNLIASMSRKANCYDNAYIESFWSSLKYEVVYQRRFATRADARVAIFDYIESFYNRARLHSSLGYVSPVTFEASLTTQKP